MSLGPHRPRVWVFWAAVLAGVTAGLVGARGQLDQLAQVHDRHAV